MSLVGSQVGGTVKDLELGRKEASVMDECNRVQESPE